MIKANSLSLIGLEWRGGDNDGGRESDLADAGAAGRHLARDRTLNRQCSGLSMRVHSAAVARCLRCAVLDGLDRVPNG